MYHNFRVALRRFDEPDNTFENQLILGSLPKLIITPFENMVNICTFNLSDKNKDVIVGLLADACCERLEQFINQVSTTTKCYIHSVFLFPSGIYYLNTVYSEKVLLARLYYYRIVFSLEKWNIIPFFGLRV